MYVYIFVYLCISVSMSVYICIYITISMYTCPYIHIYTLFIHISIHIQDTLWMLNNIIGTVGLVHTHTHTPDPNPNPITTTNLTTNFMRYCPHYHYPTTPTLTVTLLQLSYVCYHYTCYLIAVVDT